MRFLITVTLSVDAETVQRARELMEDVDGAAFRTFERAVRPQIDGEVTVIRQVRMDPADDAAHLVARELHPRGHVSSWAFPAQWREQSG